jgi:hypothetical protein
MIWRYAFWAMSSLVTTLVIPLAYSQPTSLTARLDTLLTRAIQQDHIPGAVEVVILGERIQYERASGSANLDTGQVAPQLHPVPLADLRVQQKVGQSEAAL